MLEKLNLICLPDTVLFYLAHAAIAAGLGEIGWSKIFLSPQFGPRQKLFLIIIDAPLEPDTLFEGEIFDRCMLCVKDCSAKTISKTEKVAITVGGKRLEWNKLDENRCLPGYAGGVPEASPFTPRDGLLQIHYNRRSIEGFHHLGAIEGAKGCIRACMIHLVTTNRISEKFKNPFRKKKTWWLSRS